MSDPKLTVQYDRTKMLYYLAWYDDEDGQGGEIDIEGHSGPEPTDRDHWEHWTACMVASQDYCAEARAGIYMWETETLAKAAARTIRARIKAGRELPEWAKKALAAGWKAPKGWKP